MHADLPFVAYARDKNVAFDDSASVINCGKYCPLSQLYYPDIHIWWWYFSKSKTFLVIVHVGDEQRKEWVLLFSLSIFFLIIAQ